MSIISCEIKYFKNDCPELNLLFCCARSDINAKYFEKVRTFLEQKIDWQYLLETARKHGVMPLLAYNLPNVDSKEIPKSVLSQLQSYLKNNAFHSLFLNSELAKILELFELNDIAAIPFKGVLFAASIYQNPSLRQTSDLDILIHSKDFDKAKNLLLSQEYKLIVQVPWECHLVAKNQVNIDLHAEIAPQHIICPLNSDDLWEYIEPFSLGKIEVSNFSPEILIVIICLNGVKECWQSLSRICDVAELINNKEIDWQKVIELGEKWGFKRITLLGCILAHSLLDVELPDIIWQQIKLDSKVNKLALKVTENLFVDQIEPVGEVEKTLFCISARERWRDKINSFIGLMNHSGWILPTKNDKSFIKLPKVLYFVYYIIRPYRIVRKYYSK